MFKKLLIANRGEIAVRIVRAAQDLGVATVAVHAQDDAGALHTLLADETVALPATGPAASPELLVHLPTCFYDAPLFTAEIQASGRRALVLPSQLFNAPVDGLPAAAMVAPEVLAARLDLSPHQLSELLNTRLGKGFARYVREQRVEAAQTMLRDEPAASVLSVGLSVGFSATSNFYDAFREIAGTTPGQYRKLQRRSPAAG